ncbi:MAG: iron ABC transporter substrate-binding protein, partial [Alphaproteobacteria bacterium]
RTGIPYLLLDGSLAGTAALYRRLGDLLGVPQPAATLARYADETMAEAARRLAAIPQRPRVYYGRGADGLETAPEGSIVAEILAAVGAVNVAGKSTGGGERTFVPVTAAELRGWNPEVILTSEAAFGRALAGGGAWGDLRAVGDRRVYLAPRLPFGWIDEPPGVNRLLGVRWLLALLYPEPAHDDMKATVGSFYELFYHRRPSGAEIARLLAPAP